MAGRPGLAPLVTSTLSTMATEKTYTFTLTEMGDAAENVRDVLTSALHGRDTRDINLLKGSKTAIRQAIFEAIIEGVDAGRRIKAEREANGVPPVPHCNSVRAFTSNRGAQLLAVKVS